MRPLDRFAVSAALPRNTKGNSSWCGSKRGYKSLAFTTYFKQPALGVDDYEFLSRSTASVLAVDPKDLTGEGPYGHLEAADMQRKVRDFKRQHNFSPAVGGTGTVKDMGWLEFVPKEHRVNLHVLCSSHVVSPFLWLDYYPHDWLTQVRQEHCKYSLEVIDSKNPKEPLASFELHNSPIHHPEGRDIALMHIKDEEVALKEMKKLGVQVHYLRDPEKLFSKGETIFFDGFVVRDPSRPEAVSEDMAAEDTRLFEPYEEVGTLSFHTNDRFFAKTSAPLPEGLCGAPAMDADGDLCGVVEGIVPTDHENQDIAGNAAFLPSFVLASFVDYAERFMLEQLMPKDIFQSVVKAKSTNSIGGNSMNLQDSPEGEGGWEEAYERQIETMKKQYSKEEVDAILWNVKREREEVLKIMDTEGGEMGEVIERVRAQTLVMREQAIEEHKKGNVPNGGGADDGGDGDDRQSKA